jgi:hypothetical protein
MSDSVRQILPSSTFNTGRKGIDTAGLWPNNEPGARRHQKPAMKNVKLHTIMRFMHRSRLPFIWAILLLGFSHLMAANAAPLQEGPSTEGVYFSEVKLRSFAAVRQEGQIVIKWETEFELHNAGFNLYRTEHGSPEVIRLNDSLIATRALQGSAGATYEVVDTSVLVGIDYDYWIESVDVQGFPTYLGQITAPGQDVGSPEVPRVPFRTFLPMIRNG